LPGLLIFPLVELQTALNVNRLALLDVFLNRLGSLPEKSQVNECRFFLLLVVVVDPRSIDRNPKLADCRAFGG